MNKKIIIVLLKGLGIILLFKIIFTVLNFTSVVIEFRSFSPEQVIEVTRSHAITIFSLFTIALNVLFFLVIVLSGYFVAERLKQRRFLYGVILGVLYFLLYLAFSYFLTFLPKNLIYGNKLPDEIYLDMRKTQISVLVHNIPLGLLRAVALSGLGGVINEFVHKRNHG